MPFEKPPLTPAPPEQFDFDESSVAAIAGEAAAIIQQDPRFRELVQDLAGDPALAKAFHDDFLAKLESLDRDWRKIHETEAAPPALKLKMEEVLQLARLVAEELGVDMHFFENDFEAASDTVVDETPAPGNQTDLGRQALARLQAMADAAQTKPANASLTPKSDGNQAKLAQRALVSLQAELGVRPTKKPTSVVERRAPSSETGSHAEALRARAEKLFRTGWPYRPEGLPPLEIQRHRRTVDSVKKLKQIWVNSNNRDEIIAEADRRLSGWLSKIDSETLDEHLLANKIFTALLITAEKNWDGMRPTKDPSQIRGTVL
jgi:hypothetical protein